MQCDNGITQTSAPGPPTACFFTRLHTHLICIYCFYIIIAFYTVCPLITVQYMEVPVIGSPVQFNTTQCNKLNNTKTKMCYISVEA